MASVQSNEVVYDTPCVYVMRIVKPLRHNKIVHISSGSSHTAAITNYGQLLTFGSNKCGQLGLGDFRGHPYINVVSGVLAGRKVTHVSCGDNFTVIATDDNQIFACGSFQDGRLGIPICGQNVALPRAIFGSLHAVSSICSSHWGTILVADQVISQKTISSAGSTRSTSNSSEIGSERAYTPDDGGNELDSERGGKSTLLMSSTPAWVKQEYKDAGDPDSHQLPPDLKLNLLSDSSGESSVPRPSCHKNETRYNSFSEQNNNMASSPEDMLAQIEALSLRVKQLEGESHKLREENTRQRCVIEELTVQLGLVENTYP